MDLIASNCQAMPFVKIILLLLLLKIRSQLPVAIDLVLARQTFLVAHSRSALVKRPQAVSLAPNCTLNQRERPSIKRTPRKWPAAIAASTAWTVCNFSKSIPAFISPRRMKLFRLSLRNQIVPDCVAIRKSTAKTIASVSTIASLLINLYVPSTQLITSSTKLNIIS